MTGIGGVGNSGDVDGEEEEEEEELVFLKERTKKSSRAKKTHRK